MARAAATLVAAVAGSAATTILTTLVAAVLAPFLLFVAGCSGGEPVSAVSGEELRAGTVYLADLDGDDADEQLLIAGTPASLTITDGDAVYRSRERWQVVQARLGDTDHDGLLEIVALVDDEEGRHLGLFAHFGGQYRERLVTSELSPRPLSLEIVSGADLGGGPGTVPGAEPGADLGARTGDLVKLTVEPTADQTEAQIVLCRWNGFGFTIIEDVP